MQADMDQPVEKSPRRHDHRPARDHRPIQGPDTAGPAGPDNDLRDDSLIQAQSRHPFQATLHGQPVPALSHWARGAWTAPPRLRLSRRNWIPVSSARSPINAAEGIDFPDEMPLRQASDGRIAGHLGDRFQVDGDQAGPQPHRARRGGRFAPRVTGADNDDVIIR